MAQGNPTRLVVQRWTADTYCNRGDIEDADHQPDRARGFFEKAVAIRQRRVEADPSDELAIADLADSLRRIGTTFQASSRPADAVQYFRRSIAIAARIAARERTRHEQVPLEGRDLRPPDCPSCGKPMVLRTARKGKSPGSRFWGCAGYPVCKPTRMAAETNHHADGSDRSDPTDPTDRCDRPPKP
jgi:hypothetical protein